LKIEVHIYNRAARLLRHHLRRRCGAAGRQWIKKIDCRSSCGDTEIGEEFMHPAPEGRGGHPSGKWEGNGCHSQRTATKSRLVEVGGNGF
jgi:hypothetical protein